MAVGSERYVGIQRALDRKAEASDVRAIRDDLARKAETTEVAAIRDDLDDVRGAMRWGTYMVLGAVILAVLKLILGGE